MKTIMLIIMFLIIGALFIVAENNLALKDSEARKEFSKQYGLWFEKLFTNLGQATGYVIKLNWLPENS